MSARHRPPPRPAGWRCFDADCGLHADCLTRGGTAPQQGCHCHNCSQRRNGADGRSPAGPARMVVAPEQNVLAAMKAMTDMITALEQRVEALENAQRTPKPHGLGDAMLALGASRELRAAVMPYEDVASTTAEGEE